MKLIHRAMNENNASLMVIACRHLVVQLKRQRVRTLFQLQTFLQLEVQDMNDFMLLMMAQLIVLVPLQGFESFSRYEEMCLQDSHSINMIWQRGNSLWQGLKRHDDGFRIYSVVSG